MPKIKIFESGEYPQGSFNKSLTKSIFSKAKDTIKGIFAHTSKWDNKEPVQIADFNNIEIVEEGEKALVYANISFNELGQSMKDKGFFSGVSVELPNNILSNIAILPRGVQPAISGAEFEKTFEFALEYIETNNTEIGGEKMDFTKILADIATLTAEEKLKFIEVFLTSLTLGEKVEAVDCLKDGMTTGEVKKLDTVADLNEPEEMEMQKLEIVKTEAEIRAEVKAEFEETARKKSEYDELVRLGKEKTIPALHSIVEFAAKKASEEKVLHEFSTTDKVRAYDKMKGILLAIEKPVMQTEFAKASIVGQEVDEISKIATETRKNFNKKSK